MALSDLNKINYPESPEGFIGTIFDPSALDKDWYSINEPLFIPRKCIAGMGLPRLYGLDDK